MRSPFSLLLCTVFYLVLHLSAQAQEIWTVQKPGEMSTTDFYILENGSRTTGLLIGKKSGGSQGDELLCYVMTNGYQWNSCPPGFTNFSMAGGALIHGAKYASPTTLYAIRTEIKGFSAVTALVKTDAFLNNMIVLRVFNNDTEPVNGALAVNGNTIWIGRNDGKIFRSEDGGATFETFTITNDSAVEIYQIEFTDALHGWAAGGATQEEETGEGKKITVLSKGGVWITADGGETWTAIRESLPYAFIKVYPITLIPDTTITKWYAYYVDNDSYDSGNVSAHVGATTDGFATLSIAEPQANTGKKFNGFQAGGLNVIGGTDIWLGGLCNDFKACSVVSFDGGATWMEMFLPTNIGVSFMWSIKAQNFIDSKHGWAATSVNAILRWGDPNEDFTEEPDTEQPDTGIPDTSIADETPSPDDVATDGVSEDDDSSLTPDETATDAATGDDSDGIIGEDPAGCGCSLVG